MTALGEGEGTDAAGEGGTYDYVIAGGGTAGCVLAARLSASGRHRVCLIEAGPARQSGWVPVPAGFAKLMVRSPHNWALATEPEPEPATRNRIIAIPKGRGLGGSTLINGMIWVRGQKADYDGWAQRGCAGWSFADVLPVFRRIEDHAGPAHPLRGVGGRCRSARCASGPSSPRRSSPRPSPRGRCATPITTRKIRTGWGIIR